MLSQCFVARSGGACRSLSLSLGGSFYIVIDCEIMINTLYFELNLLEGGSISNFTMKHAYEINCVPNVHVKNTVIYQSEMLPYVYACFYSVKSG